MKQKKCEFMTSEVIYLGFRINNHGVVPLKEKIRPILEAPAPENVTQLKWFLGMLNYYHRHLPQIADVFGTYARTAAQRCLVEMGVVSRLEHTMKRNDYCVPQNC